ncbi:MAG TPA: hypothetical protein VMF55_12505 [Solirubrobacterales bacterium]|nr:hypothetical protein [Solirubrobacterales bacterium]
MPILDRSIDSAPARLLDEIEEKRMELSNDQLIAEAIEIDHAGVNDRTVRRYGDHLVHFGQYLASAQGVDFYGCRSKHVRLFMAHLERAGGANPHPSRLACEWCRVRGYPDGRAGTRWSASYRKSYLAAIKFLYRHFMREEDLPDHNPASMESSPKVVHKRAYTPSRGRRADRLRNRSVHPVEGAGTDLGLHAARQRLGGRTGRLLRPNPHRTELGGRNLEDRRDSRGVRSDPETGDRPRPARPLRRGRARRG